MVVLPTCCFVAATKMGRDLGAWFDVEVVLSALMVGRAIEEEGRRNGGIVVFGIMVSGLDW